MIWVLLTVVAVLLVGVFAALLSGRIGYDPLSEPVSTQPDPGLGESFTARSITDVQFDTALRGYRMDQVDTVLDALQERLADQERQLAELRGAAGRDVAGATGAGPTGAATGAGATGAGATGAAGAPGTEPPA